jgi:Tol biopolymer transport system component
MRRALLSVLSLVAAAVMLAAGAGTASAQQYFGRNPVQWERLKFEVLKTSHFDIYFYPEDREAAEQVGRMGERWYTRFSKLLGYSFKDRQPLILYASQGHFQQTNTVGGAPGEGTGGVTEAYKRRIVLPVGASLAETDHVLGHELVHAFQYAITGQGKSASAEVGALNMPLWFIEGMAEYLSVGPVDAHTAMWMRDAVQRDADKDEKLPTVSDLAGSRYFPYRYGQALWGYIAGRYGDHVFGEALRKIGPRSNDADTVLKEVLHVDMKTLSKDWHAALKAAVATEVADKKGPASYGSALVTKKRQGGELNVGPALSPDGARVAFLSEREAFSVELFVADTKTGQVVHRLSRAAVDPHVESLGFINSAGGWSPDGKRFALGETSKGRPLLVVMDAATGKPIRQIPFPDLGEIATPCFSPDGTRIAFSALSSGFSDLFVYDLDKGALTRLTHDAFADLQPAWSPDGSRLAFVTDRFSTRLESLAYGNYRLATIDVDKGDVQPLPSFPAAKNINPQWSPSGRTLYFLSDASGPTNVYRLEVASGAVARLTDLPAGVSGITATSPALSAAAYADRLAYSVYEQGRYEIYDIDAAEGRPATTVPLETVKDAGLIPGAKVESAVAEARADAQTGLVGTDAFTTVPYKARLDLDYVGQPYVGAGVSSRYGGAFSGGVSMGFSDMLGEHNLSTILQAERVSGFTDIGAVVGYVNRKQRLNWGVQVGQIPYEASSFSTGLVTSGGQVAYAEQVYTQREIERSVSAIGFYPFNSALRLEGSAGYRHIGFDTHVQTDLYSYPSGGFLGTQNDTLPDSTGLHLFESTMAFVRDTSLYGATSPVLGQRFRLDVSPVTGSLSYTGALADFRHYVMPVRPITIAGRLMHYGRYGAGGDDPRLYPLFLGDPGLVRGYTSGSFQASDCGAASNGACPAFDRLLGSRILVANVEARAPLFGLFRGRSSYGPLPIEVGAFFDAGVAWDSHETPSLFGGSRDVVKSVGATARVNLFGFAVVEVDYAKPLDRGGHKPVFQFGLITGF